MRAMKKNPEKEKMIRIPAGPHGKLKSIAALRGIRMPELLREVIEEYLARRETGARKGMR